MATMVSQVTSNPSESVSLRGSVTASEPSSPSPAPPSAPRWRRPAPQGTPPGDVTARPPRGAAHARGGWGGGLRSRSARPLAAPVPAGAFRFRRAVCSVRRADGRTWRRSDARPACCSCSAPPPRAPRRRAPWRRQRRTRAAEVTGPRGPRAGPGPGPAALPLTTGALH